MQQGFFVELEVKKFTQSSKIYAQYMYVLNLQISVMFCMAFSELSPFLGFKLKAVLSADVNAAVLFHVVPLTCQCCFMILMFFLHFSVEELLEISLSPGKQPCCSISHPACSILEHSRTALVSCISRNIMAIH